jgi:hypothetical protein
VDGRGVKVVRRDLQEPMNYLARLSDVERWRLGDPSVDVGPERSMWAGGGVKWIQQLPGKRLFLPGGKAAMYQWLKAEERNQYMATCLHGMDALMHLHVIARRMGCNVLNRGNRIWVSGETLKGNRVTTKAANSALGRRTVQ